MANIGPLPINPSPPFILDGHNENPSTARFIKNSIRLAQDDLARAASQTVTMVATSSFTISYIGSSGPSELVVNVGDQFQISSFDLPRFAGRGRQISP